MLPESCSLFPSEDHLYVTLNKLATSQDIMLLIIEFMVGKLHTELTDQNKKKKKCLAIMMQDNLYIMCRSIS